MAIIGGFQNGKGYSQRHEPQDDGRQTHHVSRALEHRVIIEHFYQAQRRAFLGDGQASNWSIPKGYFPDVEPIVDLLHVLCYLYLAAGATGGAEAPRWSLYLTWLRACGQGRVGAVIAELGVGQGQLGKPPPGQELTEYDPRRRVAEALRYRGNNQERRDYPR